MSETNVAPSAGIWSRIARLLTWDIGPLFNRLPIRLERSESSWRISPWWPSDDATSVQRSLLRLLATANRERLDLAPLVGNFADEHRVLWRLRLKRLAKRIQAGTPLVDALEQTPGVMRDQDVLALRFATQSGILPAAYQELVRAPVSNRRLANAAIQGVVVYALAMSIAIAFIGSFVHLLIFPIFTTMAKEFGVATPWAISSQVRLSGWLVDFAWLWILIGIVALVCAVSRGVRRDLRRGFSLFLPRLGLSSRSAELLGLLSLASDAGRPISGSLSTLARYHFDKVIRQKLLFIRNEVEQGADAWHSLRDAKLITPNEAEAIRLCPDLKTQAWTLRQLADAKSNVTTIRLQRIAAWAYPILVLVLAAIVGWLSIGYFQLLWEILNAIQGWQS